MTLGSASAGVAANDVTVVGVADDWLLIPLALGFIATNIITDSPPSRSELEEGWYLVGMRIRRLRDEIETVRNTIGQATATRLSYKPAPVAPPGTESQPGETNKDWKSTDIAPPITQTAPTSKESPRRDRKECKPEPLCPHKGADDWHNYCTNVVLENEFPTCDVIIKKLHLMPR